VSTAVLGWRQLVTRSSLAGRSVTSPALIRSDTSTRFRSLALIHVLPAPNLPQEVSAQGTLLTS